MSNRSRLTEIGPKTLQYFVAVADMKSFSRAAERLHVTQPALSRQIKRLEERLGAPLLVRNGRGAHTTPAGDRVYNEAIAVQRQLNALSIELSEQDKVLKGSIIVAVTPTVEHAIPEIVEKFVARYPDVELTVRQGYSDSVRRMIELGHADIGIFPSYVEADMASREIAARKLLHEPECFVGAKAFVKARKFNQIDGLPLILPPRGNGLRAALDAFASKRGITLNIAVEVEGYDAVKALAVRGVGCAVLPMRLVSRELSSGALRILKVAEPRIERTFVIAYSRKRGLTRAATKLFDTIQKRLTAAAGTRNWINTSKIATGEDA